MKLQNIRKLAKGSVAVLLSAIMLVGAIPMVNADDDKQYERLEELSQIKSQYLDNIDKKEYPDGAMMIAESGNTLQQKKMYAVDILRQGGTEGTSKITLNTIDLTANYGKDYKLFLSPKLGDNGVDGEAKPYFYDTGVAYVPTEVDKQTYYQQDDGSVTDSDKSNVVMQADDEKLVNADDINESSLEQMPKSSQTVLEFAEGESIKTVYIQTYQCYQVKDDREFMLALSSPEDCTLGAPTSVFTIEETREKEDAKLEIYNTVVNPQSKQAYVYVERTGNTSGYTSFTFTTHEGTAESGTAYQGKSYQLKFVPELRYIKVPIEILGGAKDGTSFTADITDVSEGATVIKSEATIYFSNNAEIEDEADTALSSNGQRKYVGNGMTYTDGEKNRGYEFVDLSKFVRSRTESEGHDGDATTRYTGHSYYIQYDNAGWNPFYTLKEHSVSARSNEKINFNGVDSVRFCYDNKSGSIAGDHCAIIIADSDPLTRTCDWMNSSLSMDGEVWNMGNYMPDHLTEDFSVTGRSKNTDKYMFFELNRASIAGAATAEIHEYQGNKDCALRLNLHPYKMHMVNADPIEVLKNGKVEKINVVQGADFVDPNKGNGSYTDDAVFYRYDTTSIRLFRDERYGEVNLEGIYFYDQDKPKNKTKLYTLNSNDFQLTPEMLQEYPEVFNAQNICIKPVASLAKTNVIFQEYNDTKTGISVKTVKSGNQITALDMYLNGKKYSTITWKPSSTGSYTSYYDGDEIKFTMDLPKNLSFTAGETSYTLAFSTQSGITEQAARTGPVVDYKFTDNITVHDKVFIIMPTLQATDAHTTLLVKNPDEGISYTGKGNSKYEKKQADGSVVISGYSIGDKDFDFDSIPVGNTIALSASCDDDHIPVWKLSDGKTYVGKVFYYTVQTQKLSTINNVELTFKKANDVLGPKNKDTTKGQVEPHLTVYAPKGSILHPSSTAGIGTMERAEGAMVYIDGLDDYVGIANKYGQVRYHKVDADGNLSKEEFRPKITADIEYSSSTTGNVTKYYYNANYNCTAKVVYKGHTYYCKFVMRLPDKTLYAESDGEKVNFRFVPFTADGVLKLDYVAAGDIQPTFARAFSGDTQQMLPETITLFQERPVNFSVNFKSNSYDPNSKYTAVWSFVNSAGIESKTKTTEIEKGSTIAKMSCTIAEYAKPGDKLYVEFMRETEKDGKKTTVSCGKYETGYSFIVPNVDRELTYVPDIAAATKDTNGKIKTAAGDVVVVNPVPAIGGISPMFSFMGFMPIYSDSPTGEKDEDGHDIMCLTIGVQYSVAKKLTGKSDDEWKATSLSDKVTALTKALSEWKTNEKAFGSMSMSVSLSFTCTFSIQVNYYINKDTGKKAFTGYVQTYSASFGFSASKPFMICFVPCFANFSVTVTGELFIAGKSKGSQFNGNVDESLTVDQLKYPEAWDIEGVQNLIFSMKVGAGVGADGVLGVEGNITPTLNFSFTKMCRNVKITFKLQGGVTFYLVFGKSSKSWDIVDKTLVDLTTAKDVADVVQNAINEESENLLKTTTLADMELDKSDDEYSAMLRSGNALIDEKVLEPTTSDAHPQIVDLGNGKYFIATPSTDEHGCANILHYYIYDTRTHRVTQSSAILDELENSLVQSNDAEDKALANVISNQKEMLDDAVSLTDCGSEIMLNWVKSGYSNENEKVLDHMRSSTIATVFYNKESGEFHDYTTVAGNENNICYGIKGAYNSKSGLIQVAYNTVDITNCDGSTTLEEVSKLPAELMTFGINSEAGYSSVSDPVNFVTDKTVSSYEIAPYEDKNVIAYVGSNTTGFTLENPENEEDLDSIKEMGAEDVFGNSNKLYLQMFKTTGKGLEATDNIQLTDGSTVVANPQLLEVNAKDFNNTLLFFKNDGVYGYQNLEQLLATSVYTDTDGKKKLKKDAMKPQPISDNGDDHDVSDDMTFTADKDGNIYSFWTSPLGDETQIYARHFYMDSVDTVTETTVLDNDGNVIYNADGTPKMEKLATPLKFMHGYWGGKAQLTNGGVAGTDTGKIKSNFSVTATDKGTLLAAYSAYDWKYSGNTAEKVNNYFVIAEYNPVSEYSEVENRKSIDVSNYFPNPNESVEVTMNAMNSGIITGRDVKVTLYENDKEYSSQTFEPWLAGDKKEIKMAYTMPADVDPSTISLHYTISENGKVKYTSDSVSFKHGAKLIISSAVSKALTGYDDETDTVKYTSTVSVKNIGNADYEGGDYAELVNLDLYEMAKAINPDSESDKPFYTCYGSIALPEISVGAIEGVTFISDEIPESVFDDNGTNSANLEFVLTPASQYGWKEIKGDDKYVFIDEHSIGQFVKPENDVVSSIEAKDMELVVGKSAFAEYDAAPVSALATSEFTFTSSDEEVATVNELGMVFAQKAGTATITVQSGDAKTTFKVSVNPPLFGDVNEDGIVSVLDVTMLQRYLAELSELSLYGMAAADVNHDGILDIHDVTLIQRYLAEMADF